VIERAHAEGEGQAAGEDSRGNALARPGCGGDQRDSQRREDDEGVEVKDAAKAGPNGAAGHVYR
jgi:hypothetical protein